ncbi:hypothetical protein M514_28228 [Trichuris suis]|uniref:Uncharacterized protein n=1 Tax=Trichuris suis TaxID=68888 RepID=A0A085MQU7_9BILA|nr:hypothetical protein M514_28228 [Trichuris suis]
MLTVEMKKPSKKTKVNNIVDALNAEFLSMDLHLRVEHVRKECKKAKCESEMDRTIFSEFLPYYSGTPLVRMRRGEGLSGLPKNPVYGRG